MIPVEHGILARTILLFTARDDSKQIVWQWSLQFECLRRISQQPQIYLFRRRQDNRHRLRMDWRDDGVRFCCEETEKLMLPIDGRALWPAHATPGGP